MCIRDRHAVYADGTLHPAEEKLLGEICETLKFPKFMLRQMEILVRAGIKAGPGAGANQNKKPDRSMGLSLSEAYQLLGIDKNADKNATKRAYRKLMSQHHPDKLVAKGLPPEMIKIATEKTQSIKAAYELVKDRRGW